MPLNALLLTRDPALQLMLRRGFDDLGTRLETCASATAASDLIAKHKFEAVIVDCDDVESGEALLRGLRSHPSNKFSIVVAVVNGHTTVPEAFELGANFVLEKPVANDRLLRCLRAAHPLMIREQRRCYRHALDISVMLQLGPGPEARARLLNLSEGGMAIHSHASLTKAAQIRFRFMLPESDMWVEGKAEVLWASSEGRAGLQFLPLPQKLRVELGNWLASRLQQPPKPPTAMPARAGKALGAVAGV